MCAALALGACATNGEIRTVHDAFTGDQGGFALYLIRAIGRQWE